MTTKFKRNNIKSFIIVITLFLIIYHLSGCDKISQGEQRRKFEFLYKMNNYATLFREYTGILSYQKDFELYKKRMNKLYMDVNDMKIISGYQPSIILKEKFLSAIDANLKIIQNYEQVPGSDTLNIRDEYQIRNMNENVDFLTDYLNEEISRVGKE